jgi:acyl-homoserine lactone acylase PvdQ
LRPALIRASRLLEIAAALIALGALLAATAASAAGALPYDAASHGEFNDILPPGANGLIDLPQLVGGHPENPPHSGDQLTMYDSLTTAAPDIGPTQIGAYFKSSDFGVPAGEVARVETPEPRVTIEWDSDFGVPHIYGVTRPALMFGIGWATAEDRLFFIDALRHAGEGDLASFAGGSNVGMDASVWANEPYTHQDLVNQVNWARRHLPGGEQMFDDASSYVAGINAYIRAAENPALSATLMPAEYLALGTVPRPFTLEDAVAIATLVGGIFGGGGGDQLQNAVLYEEMAKRLGPEHRNVPGSPQFVVRPNRVRRDRSGFATFMSFVDPSDPEAPTTVHGRSFPYQTVPMPSPAVLRTIALPDPGSVRYANMVVGGSLTPTAQMRTALRQGSVASAFAGEGLLAFGRGMSNALLVSAADSANGHPLAVMGPQAAYFSPEILMEEDVHGPGIDAAGAAFAGANTYVELGHGTDYAWSATSAGQNIVDTFALPLCSPDGGRPALYSHHYLLRGRCVAMQTLTDHESWTPTLADPTPAGSVTLRAERTAFGIVIARARIRGRPVAYCNLRSTYMHELDSAVGFSMFNDPAAMRTPQAFFRAADRIGYTFNWLYANPRNIAYFNSGRNPIRAPHTNPLFPSWAAYPWARYRAGAALSPEGLIERVAPLAAHPHAIDQPFLTSWNNKQAPGYNDGATAQEFSSVYRSQLLDQGIEHYLRITHHRMTLADLIDAMGSAGTQDLRGVEVLPYALAVIGHPTGPPALLAALEALRAWVASGAHRINRAHPGPSGTYDHGHAVRIMDAWWPLWVTAEFQPALGSALLSAVEREFAIDDAPGRGHGGGHLGSSFDVGFYGIVQKDLRAVLGRHVAGSLSRIFCGRGSLRACRAALIGSLLRAAAEPAAEVYPADTHCRAGDQMCSDSIQFRAIGAITEPGIEWINRPTFQQADALLGSESR